MQLSQNYCINFCKILQENALTLTNSCKIFARVVFFCKIFARVVFFCKFFARCGSFLQNFCKRWVFFAKFLQELYSVWTNLFHSVLLIALKVRVFLNQHVIGILQSIQNQPFRVGSENDRNDLIQ